MFLKLHQFPTSQLIKRFHFNAAAGNNLTKDESEGINMAYSSYESTISPATNKQPTPLLIFHGLFGSKSNWNAFSKVYHNISKPTKRKVYAVDARNHADSPFTKSHNYDDMVMDLKKFLDTMNVKKVNLLGHCMGGRTCMLFSLKYPEMVDKLIVSDVSPITTSINFKSIALLFSIMSMIKLPANIPLSQAKNEVNRQLLPVVSNRTLRTFMMNNLVQKSDGTYKWSLNLPTLCNNYENIASFPDLHNTSFEGSVLFLAGTNSDFIQKSDLPQIKKLFPNAEMRFIEGGGHWLQAEKPVEFLKITLDFLNKEKTGNVKTTRKK